MGDLGTKAGEQEMRPKSGSLLPRVGELASVPYYVDVCKEEFNCDKDSEKNKFKKDKK